MSAAQPANRDTSVCSTDMVTSGFSCSHILSEQQGNSTKGDRLWSVLLITLIKGEVSGNKINASCGLIRGEASSSPGVKLQGSAVGSCMDFLEIVSLVLNKR